MKEYGEIDSKFRYVILASKRAKELLKGAKPKIKTKSKNLIRIAQLEVEKGLIDYEIIQSKADDYSEAEDDIFIGEELADAAEIPEEESIAEVEEEVQKKEKAPPKEKAEKKEKEKKEKKVEKKPEPKKTKKAKD